MVTCRCGCEFENDRWSSHVRCPGCGRIYANTAPDLFHPISEDELRWKCDQCGEMNENSSNGGPSTKCVKCGAQRPGSPEQWYNPHLSSILSRHSIKKRRKKR